MQVKDQSKKWEGNYSKNIVTYISKWTTDTLIQMGNFTPETIVC